MTKTNRGADTQTTQTGTRRMGLGLFVLGLVMSLVAAASALVLSIQHLTGTSLPGCGLQSACAELASGPWGRVPIVGWPVSFFGAAYFLGLLGAWSGVRPGVPAAVRWLVRAGALASLGYIGVMIVLQKACPYCIASHAANLVMLAVVEVSPRRTCGWTGARTVGVVGGVMAPSLLALIVADVIMQRRAEARAEGELSDSTQRIIDRAGGDGADSIWGEAGFSGRYRIGPEAAPIRVVMFVSYQCVDCRRIESEARGLLQQRSDISLSIKHFPMSSKCNPHMGGRDLHPNSCWAARAAEAAGILRGSDGFWQMHFWLFDRAGAFTDVELNQGLVQLGYTPAEFIPVMTGQQTLDLVRSDIEEAVVLGLHYTPFIFVNGVELRGWTVPNALTRMVQQVAATNPPPGTAAADHPPLALQKHLDDWRAGRALSIAADPVPRARGRDGAPVNIIVWSDYQVSATAALDTALRELVGSRDDVRVEFRHYPVDQACNPYTQRTANPNACRMARAAEAAGLLAGPDAFWRAHEWLLAFRQPFDGDDDVTALAGALGLNPAALREAMDRPEVAEAIRSDAEAGKRTGLSKVPWIVMNGRYLPRWKLQERSIFPEIVETSLTAQR